MLKTRQIANSIHFWELQQKIEIMGINEMKF